MAGGLVVRLGWFRVPRTLVNAPPITVGVYRFRGRGRVG